MGGRQPTYFAIFKKKSHVRHTQKKIQKTKSPKESFEKGERMQISSSSGNNDLKRKKFDRMKSNKKQCEMVLRMCGLILFQFPMGTYLLEMNM